MFSLNCREFGSVSWGVLTATREAESSQDTKHSPLCILNKVPWPFLYFWKRLQELFKDNINPVLPPNKHTQLCLSFPREQLIAMFTFSKICIKAKYQRRKMQNSFENYLLTNVFILRVAYEKKFLSLWLKIIAFNCGLPQLPSLTVISNWFSTAWVSCGKTTQNSSNKQTSPLHQTSNYCDTWLYFLNIYPYIPGDKYRPIPNKWSCYPYKYKHGARVSIMARTLAHLPHL